MALPSGGTDLTALPLRGATVYHDRIPAGTLHWYTVNGSRLLTISWGLYATVVVESGATTSSYTTTGVLAVRHILLPLRGLKCSAHLNIQYINPDCQYQSDGNRFPIDIIGFTRRYRININRSRCGNLTVACGRVLLTVGYNRSGLSCNQYG